jgi:hypothetical protein
LTLRRSGRGEVPPEPGTQRARPAVAACGLRTANRHPVHKRDAVFCGQTSHHIRKQHHGFGHCFTLFTEDFAPFDRSTACTIGSVDHIEAWQVSNCRMFTLYDQTALIEGATGSLGGRSTHLPAARNGAFTLCRAALSGTFLFAHEKRDLTALSPVRANNPQHRGLCAESSARRSASGSGEAVSGGPRRSHRPGPSPLFSVPSAE